jgi:hypothetical protein
MKFKKIEILEIKNGTNVYYGTIENVPTILVAEKNIPDEITIDEKNLEKKI